jgi:polyhydroxybutyrate depolymerase
VKGAALAVAALVLLVPAGACGRGTAGQALSGSGCAVGEVMQAGTTTEALTVDGHDRTYLLTLPDGNQLDPRPVVFDFPGLGESAREEAQYSHLAELAAARGWIGVTPQASGAVWTIPPLPGPNDFDFVTGVIDDLEAHLCVNPALIFVAGISNGAAFAGALACRQGLFIQGLAMVAGINAYAQCSSAQPLRVIGFNGTADPIIPYNGGRIFGGSDQKAGGIVPPATDAFRGWGSRNQCFGSPVTADVASDVQLMTFSGKCQAATELYTLEGGGHTWPGAAPVADKMLGATNTSISASKLILDFFARPAP